MNYRIVVLKLFTFLLSVCSLFVSIFILPVIEELKATGKFELMDISVDEDEHSMEMHLPYLAKVFEGYKFHCLIIKFNVVYFSDYGGL